MEDQTDKKEESTDFVEQYNTTDWTKVILHNIYAEKFIVDISGDVEWYDFDDAPEI